MIFEVTPAHVEALSDTDLRTLVGYLAERDAVKAGHSASAVTYGGHQNAKDGGIDVRVALDGDKIDGFIPRLATGYQAKAETFTVADITKEMRPKGKLRDGIRELGEAGGAYIIVSSKGSVSDASLRSRKKAMAEAIADEPSAKALFVDFYDKRRVASWVNQHPGIVAWVRDQVGMPISGWRPFGDWSSSPDADGAQYVFDDGVRLLSRGQNDQGLRAEDGIERLRSVLNEPRGMVRLVGLSGVGKTRLVQALFDERLGTSPLDQHLAVYTDMGENPDPVPLELVSRLQANDQRCILVVDNCGAELHRKLATRLTSDSLISMITIEYDIRDDEPEQTDVFRLEPASKEVIEKILQPRFPNLTNPEIHTISDFSEGNFRIALALASTSKDGQSLANLKDIELFNRLFRQKNEDNPALLRAAKVCSLVYSFDVENIEGEGAELPLLANLAEQSVSEFHGHVAELNRRQLVQVRARWRALLPHAIAHRLAKLALEDVLTRDLKAFIDAAPERLFRSFSRRLGCLHDNAPAQKIVSEWLCTDGKISEVGSLTPPGMTILDNVAPVHPAAILGAIHSAAANDASFFDENRNASGLIRLLRSLAYEPELFDEATRLIAGFARSKTESNNMGDAVNVLKSLFYIHLSGTHASPKQRADLLRSLAAGGSQADEDLVITALDAMLECDHFSSSYGFEFGTRKRDYGFYPRTWGEQWDWYATAFSLADDLAKIPSMRGRVRSMLASQFSQLAPQVRLDDLIALAESFLNDGGWPEGWAGVRGALRKAKDAKSDENIFKLTALESKLAPASLAHRIASYVLHAQRGELDLVDIDFADEKRYEKTWKQIDAICEGIGAELANDLDALRAHLPELLASQSRRVFTVAKGIGRGAPDPSGVWNVIEGGVLTPQRNGTVYSFPGAFLSGLAERDRNCANKLLDVALANSEWHPFLPHMQGCVGVDAAGSQRLITAIPLPSLPAWALHDLAMGSTNDLDGTDFRDLLTVIAAKADGFETAIDILYMRLHSLRSEKKQITDVERGVARELLGEVRFDKNDNRGSHRIAEIIRDCLSDPDDRDLAIKICQRLLGAVAEWKVSPWDYSEVVAELAGVFPNVVLGEALEAAGSDGTGGRGLFTIFRQGRPCPLRKINEDDLFAWAHEKPGTRFTALASAILGWRGPKATENPDVAQDDEDEAGGLRWTPTAMRLICEAPDPVAILQEFAEQFAPSAWSGSRANILAGREPLLLALANNTDQRIQDWANAAIPKLRDDVKKARKWEAENDRERDERFDW